MPVLDEILNRTRATLPALRANRAVLERAATQRLDPPDFTQGFRRNSVGLIAEVKRRSPSAGAINEGLDPVALALAYERGGAAAISVLTEREYFGGSLADLSAVVGAVEIPVLRKDFILDEVQLLEARAAGAAAALLIVRALDQATLLRLQQFATDLRLTPLVETHSAEEILRALDAGAEVIGVNARDLDTLTIDTAAAWRLLRTLPRDCIAIAESGMSTGADVEAAAVSGADGVLIGGALASAADPAARARECSAVVRHGR
jgi:indole-3-glycerol phosphate synthase